MISETASGLDGCSELVTTHMASRIGEVRSRSTSRIGSVW